MAAREFHYRWTWDFTSSPEVLWPLVADTNRFNSDAGLPPVERIEGGGPRRGTPGKACGSGSWA